MTPDAFKPLFVLTLKNPRAAARLVLQMDLPPQALWMALSLVSVLTSLMFAGILQIVELPNTEMGEMARNSPGYSSPLVFALMQWGRAVLSVFVLNWVGQSLGGKGRLKDVLAVITWLQIVGLCVIVALTVVGVILPFVTTLGMFAFFVWWIWAVVGFLDEAHELNSPIKAFGVLAMSVLGVLIGLSIIMGVILSLFVGLTGGV
ncbi:Yip1 family protein [Roseovarius aestuariivivens]|uniref:Yip1 family protein n=1 Tax=Roseovarius aestuariivivens TaxID=1888910 RepID=UPI00107FF984|nr:Yip1 family protein [Roseovarius aestuariivivens]